VINEMSGASVTQSKQVFVHIGLPKTGTTFLQGVLSANRKQLAKQSILYPGRGPAHFLAAQDLAEHQFLGQDNPKVAGAWNSLVAESRRWRGKVLISHELFTLAQKRHVQRLMGDLAGYEVHVIVTVRDLERQIPAVWQERLKNGAKTSFNRHFQQVHEQANQPELAGFWRQQDAARILSRWLSFVPPQHVHMVTVPQRGAPRDLLWDRFATVIGIEPGSLDVNQPVAGNVSLSAEQARFLRRVNAVQEVPRPLYLAVVKRYLSQKAPVRMQGGGPHGLTAEQRSLAAAWSHELVEFVQESGLDVQGDLSDIYPAPVPPSEVTPFDVVDAGREAAVGVRMTSSLIHWMAQRATGEPLEPPHRTHAWEEIRRRFRGISHRVKSGR